MYHTLLYIPSSEYILVAERFPMPHALLRSGLGGDAVIVFSPVFRLCPAFTVAEQALDLTWPSMSGQEKLSPQTLAACIVAFHVTLCSQHTQLIKGLHTPSHANDHGLASKTLFTRLQTSRETRDSGYKVNTDGHTL